MQYELTTPCTAADLAPLKAGDTVLLSGVVYTARDQAHKRMLEALDKGEKLPFDLEGSAIYYVGPTPERPGEVIGSAGPTTSGRMDADQFRKVQSFQLGFGQFFQTFVLPLVDQHFTQIPFHPVSHQIHINLNGNILIGGVGVGNTNLG